jgi:uncharacterized protein DUF6915
MHPYHHALSSQREHGGAAADYLPLHNWFDASKSTLAHFTHRALNHHREGIAEAIRLFGTTILNADRAAVSVEALALQHLAEDMSIIPAAADWLRHIELPAAGAPLTPPRAPPSADQLAAASARHFDTAPDALLPLHSWFLETAAWFDDARHFAMRHHSFGIFQAEQRFGVVLTQNRCPVPTRIAAEWHVRTVLGRIPAAADFLRRIKGQPWMAAAQNARRRGLCDTGLHDRSPPPQAAAQQVDGGEPHHRS